MHEWDGQTPLEETLSALTHLVDSGKVRYVGVSNFSAWHLMKALGVAERTNFVPLVSQQIHYSLQAREAEYELVPLALDQGIGILVWSPLAGGLLSGKYRRDVKPPPDRGCSPTGTSPRSTTRTSSTTSSTCWSRSARRAASRPRRSPWPGRWRAPAISTVIIGARTSEQLADNLAAADLVLTDDETRRLEEVSRPCCSIRTGTRSTSAGKRLGAADLSLLGRHL